MIVRAMEEMRARQTARVLPAQVAKENIGVTPRYRPFFFGVEMLRVISIYPLSN